MSSEIVVILLVLLIGDRVRSAAVFKSWGASLDGGMALSLRYIVAPEDKGDIFSRQASAGTIKGNQRIRTGYRILACQESTRRLRRKKLGRNNFMSSPPPSPSAANTPETCPLSPLWGSDPDGIWNSSGWSQGNTPPSMRAYLHGDDNLPSTDHGHSVDDWAPQQEAELHATLDGPDFACGTPSHRSPLLARFAPDFDPWHFSKLVETAASQDEAAIQAFCRACIDAASRERPDGTQPTAAEREQHGLFGLLALCTLTMAKALTRRDLGSRRDGMVNLRLLLDAMEVLVEVEERAIQAVI
ncbi:hypothetical protein BV20DRAFT_979400 [Pilatotrama ljubarskyi]|nr:hypothetical protein BV20DRAFT_979400 [Pilatotrama ljubarskyi]